MHLIICPFRAVTALEKGLMGWVTSQKWDLLHKHPPSPTREAEVGKAPGIPGRCQIQARSFPLHGACASLQSLSTLQASPCHLWQSQQFYYYYFLIFTYQNHWTVVNLGFKFLKDSRKKIPVENVPNSQFVQLQSTSYRGVWVSFPAEGGLSPISTVYIHPYPE